MLKYVEIPIKDQTIRLGQFLKLANVVASGGEAKMRIKAGEVEVNGEVDTRRGAQLHPGDKISMSDQNFVIISI